MLKLVYEKRNEAITKKMMQAKIKYDKIKVEKAQSLMSRK